MLTLIATCLLAAGTTFTRASVKPRRSRRGYKEVAPSPGQFRLPAKLAYRPWLESVSLVFHVSISAVLSI